MVQCIFSLRRFIFSFYTLSLKNKVEMEDENEIHASYKRIMWLEKIYGYSEGGEGGVLHD